MTQVPYMYMHMHMYMYVYMCMYICIRVDSVWILVSFLLAGQVLTGIFQVAGSSRWCNGRWRVLSAQFTVQFIFDVTGVFRVTGSSCCRNGR